jgi:phosphoribosylformylglycinamidine cyclo-ligase
MGVGFAVYVSPEDVERTLKCAQEHRYTAWKAGIVRKEGDRKAVVIPPLGITFEADTLQVR